MIRPKKKKGIGAIKAPRIKALAGDQKERTMAVTRLEINELFDGIILQFTNANYYL